MAKTIIDWANKWAVRDTESVKFTPDQWAQIEKWVRDDRELCRKVCAASEGLVRIRRVKNAGECDGQWEVERIT